MRLPKSAGEPKSTVPPRPASRAFILECASAAFISFLSLVATLVTTVLRRSASVPGARLISRHELAPRSARRQQLSQDICLEEVSDGPCVYRIVLKYTTDQILKPLSHMTALRASLRF